MPKYRCVIANDGTGDVLSIGYDEKQGGRDYHGIGKWSEFTFSEMPKIPADVEAKLNPPMPRSVLKVPDSTAVNPIVVKTVVEIETELGGK